MAESFGMIDRRPNGRYRARFTEPDPHGTSGKTAAERRITAPGTFATKSEARQWLATQQAALANGTWVHPDIAAREAAAAAVAAAAKATPFGTYATRWIETRTNSKGEPLRPRTRKEYERMLSTGPLAHWSEQSLNAITPEMVRDWHADLLKGGKLTQTARAYDLMKSIMKTAVEDELLRANPCRVKGGSITSTGRKVRPPTDSELDSLITNIEDRYKALVVIAAAGGLRYGEALGLTSDDVTVERDDDGHVDAVRVVVERSVVEGSGLAREAGPTKTAAGQRAIALFGGDAAIVAAHVEGMKPGALLWTDTQGNYVSQSSVNNAWRKARKAAGCPDVTFHALRHYAGTRYAQSGATVAETMARLGHSSAKAAMRYQHSGTRDDELARRAARP